MYPFEGLMSLVGVAVNWNNDHCATEWKIVDKDMWSADISKPRWPPKSVLTCLMACPKKLCTPRLLEVSQYWSLSYNVGPKNGFSRHSPPFLRQRTNSAFENRQVVTLGQKTTFFNLVDGMLQKVDGLNSFNGSLYMLSESWLPSGHILKLIKTATSSPSSLSSGLWVMSWLKRFNFVSSYSLDIAFLNFLLFCD